MRVLIDECLPRKLKNQLPEYDVHTVAEMGWSGTKNGALLKLMTDSFDVLITIDQNLILTPYQPESFAASRKMVGKLAAKQLHFGNPFPLAFCYSVLIVVSLCLGVSM